MGRPESEVDPTAGPLERFAVDLRALRREAGAPPYRDMARRAGFSATTLSAAASGRRMPSLDVVRAYVAVCGGDVAAWERRWVELGAARPGPPAVPARPGRPRWRRRSWWAAAVTVALAVGLGAVATRDRYEAAPETLVAEPTRSAAATADSPVPTGSAPLGPAPNGAGSTRDPVADGADPKRSGCAPDAVTLDDRDVIAEGNVFLGSLELRYSPRCRVGWGRFTPDRNADRVAPREVMITAVRPADGQRRVFQIDWVGPTPYFGAILLAREGCVSARLDLRGGPRVVAPLSTLCLP